MVREHAGDLHQGRTAQTRLLAGLHSAHRQLDLYRTSGHFPYYADAQYPPMFMNPLCQTVDTWLTLLEKKHLTPEREKSFLELIESITKGEYPKGEDDYPRYPWSQIGLDLRALWLSYQRAKSDDEKKTDLTQWLYRARKAICSSR